MASSAGNSNRKIHVPNSPSSIPQTQTQTQTQTPFRNLILHQFLPLSTASASNPTSPSQPTFTSNSLSHHSFLKSSTMCHSERETCDSSDSEQRFKRLIRNRESGARSRARKQAYKDELETKLALLIEENSRLRKQIEELQLRLMSPGSSNAKPSKMRTLCRTLTSPF
ncbi:protein FD-like [Abrus precatorius]|uniref:Protein FD-like n=1 Tax=Abrus precatorius TaxID=3816 RepID=A0A8B8LJ17_ABRPR|nr:protein FD-like [Abrus precatorius]